MPPVVSHVVLIVAKTNPEIEHRVTISNVLALNDIQNSVLSLVLCVIQYWSSCTLFWVASE